MADIARSWQLTSLEFVAIWEPMGDGMLPWPLSCVIDTPLREDYEREKHQTRERLRAERGAVFDDVLEALARPDLRIAVQGRNGCEPENPAGAVRALAVRRNGRGYLVRQLPGRTIWHSDGFHIEEHHPADLAAAVVACLPQCPSGRLREVRLPTPQTSDGRQHCDRARGPLSDVWDTTKSPTGHVDRFLQASASSVGLIEIAQGWSPDGPRGIRRFTRGWHDLDDDGRYMLTFGTMPLAVAVDTKALTSRINADLAEAERSLAEACAWNQPRGRR